VATALPPFQTVLDEQREDVYRFLRALVGANEADDCFQETLMSAIRAYPKLEPDANVRAWLFTIARHKAIDAHRSRGRRAIPVEDVPERAAAASAASTNGIGVDPELWALVRRLPTKQRSAVALRFVADMSHAEVAVTLNCSEEAARRSLHEGLKKLREEWSA
jgi:RNA polymerase sigma factor (sigma-70 family)